jgi:hypothetical protein
MDMKIYRTLTIALAAILLFACAPAEVSGHLIVQTTSASPADVSGTAKILAARFEEVLPSRRSSVIPAISGGVVEFTFRGEMPPEQQLRYLATTRGELYIGPADQPTTVWVSDLDVDAASLSVTGQGAALSLLLSEKAGAVLAEATAKNVGRTVLVTWERRPILNAPIRGAFGRDFQFTVPSKDEGRMMRVILQGGRLPAAVDSVEIKHGA